MRHTLPLIALAALLLACSTPVSEPELPVRKQCSLERNRIAMSGCSAYTRNDEGYLCSVRISDYAGHEGEIDWTKTPVSREEAYSINLVDAFQGGCGMKPQEEY